VAQGAAQRLRRRSAPYRGGVPTFLITDLVDHRPCDSFSTTSFAGPDLQVSDQGRHRLDAGEKTMKTCLVVDDSSVIRKVARRILEGMKFEISEAEDGVQALDMCRVRLPDVVFLDLNMPRMDGMTFLKEMRNLPGGSRPKVVFATTERDMAHINRALRAGADDFIMKPFDRDSIQAKFHRAGLV
jgi:two-component system, chemotaxis family, chemotaxis protein CheY